MSSANSIGFRISDTISISFIYKIKSNGPNIDPCGTPHVTWFRRSIFVSFSLKTTVLIICLH